MTFRLFISSVQSEFATERRRLADYIRQDALLGRFFVPFARGWTAANLVTTHDSRPRNETLAKALDWAGFVERSGHGTEFIVEKCEASGLKTPEYRADCEDFHAIIWRKNLVRESRDLVQDGHKTGTRQAYDGHKTTRERLLESLTYEHLSRKEIAENLNVSWNTGFFKQTQDILVADGLVALTIPDKPKSRYQKYRLTPKGTELQKGGAQ